jgi:hypothetical protein
LNGGAVIGSGPVERLTDQCGAGGTPGGHPLLRLRGQREAGGPPVGRVRLAVQQALVDERVDQGADRVAGEVECLRGAGDPDAGPQGAAARPPLRPCDAARAGVGQP